MVFLHISKKMWVVRDKEYPVIEDVPMKDLMWFRQKIKEASKLKKDPKADELDALKFDEEWWEKVCEIGLNTTSEELMESGITAKEFRELMAEVYNFLASYGTIEEAKQSALYVAETKKKEKKQ